MMQIVGMPFGTILVSDVEIGQDSLSVTMTLLERASTPCGTLNFPSGTRLRLSKAEVDGEDIRPISGGRIEPAN